MKLRWLSLGLVLVTLLVPALMITGARLLDPPDGRWVRLVAFTPFAFVLYAVALLVLLAVGVATHGFRRGAAGFLAVLCVPLLALHAWWAAPVYGGSPAHVAQGDVLTVLAGNLSYGDADPARVLGVALRHDADVLVLSEVTPAALAGMREAGLREAYPSSEGAAAEGVAGTMVFSRLPLADVAALGTSFGGYSLTVRAPGGPVNLLAVHPSPPLDDAAAWRSDHAVVRRAAVALTGPTAIVGDLNATLDHLPLRELRGRGFEDAAEQTDAGWQPTWPSSGEVSVLGLEVPSLLAIDHVLLSDELAAVGTESVSVPGTDHRALVVRVARR